MLLDAVWQKDKTLHLMYRNTEREAAVKKNDFNKENG